MAVALGNETRDSERTPNTSPVTTGSHTHDTAYLLAMIFTTKGYSGLSRKATAVSWNGISLSSLARMDFDSGNSVDRDLVIDFYGGVAAAASATGAVTHDGTSGTFVTVFQSIAGTRGPGNVGSDALTTFGSLGTSLNFSVTNQEAGSMAIGAICAQQTASPFTPSTATEVEDYAGTALDLWFGYQTGSGSKSFNVSFSGADAGGKAIEFLPGGGGNRAMIIFSERAQRTLDRIFGRVDPLDGLWKPKPQILTPAQIGRIA